MYIVANILIVVVNGKVCLMAISEIDARNEARVIRPSPPRFHIIDSTQRTLISGVMNIESWCLRRPDETLQTPSLQPP